MCVQCDLATPGELEFCDELKCYKCFNTSAKRGEGITEAIECLLEDVRTIVHVCVCLHVRARTRTCMCTCVYVLCAFKIVGSAVPKAHNKRPGL